jgi:5-methylcytosine-specific restriction endonuclease McrA
MSAAPSTPEEWLERYMPWRLRDPYKAVLPKRSERVHAMFGKVLPKMRNHVVARDGRCCRYCRRTVFRYRKHPRPPDNELTIDHVVPRAHGGTNSKDNLVVSCRRCNKDRARWVFGRPLPAPLPLEPVERGAA